MIQSSLQLILRGEPMFNRILVPVILSFFLVACASWSSNSSSANEQDSPTVGSRDSSDFLFGQAANSPPNIKEDNGNVPVVARPANASAAK
jgi:outer membrane PBP1 activator LpoA protein